MSFIKKEPTPTPKHKQQIKKKKVSVNQNCKNCGALVELDTNCEYCGTYAGDISVDSSAGKDETMVVTEIRGGINNPRKMMCAYVSVRVEGMGEQIWGEEDECGWE